MTTENLNPRNLPRMLPRGTRLQGEALSELGRKASEVLGYEYLAQNTADSPRRSLSQVLQELQIEVFETEAVEKYMAEKLEAIRNKTQKLPKESNPEEDEEDNNYDPSSVSWHKTRIGQYNHPMPESVIALAIFIKESCPGADFTVHSLAKADPDPFLSVRYNGELFYIEVWAEPKFTGKLTKLDAERANLRNKPQEEGA